MYEIFAYWNSAQIEAILNAVVGVIGGASANDDYLTLTRLTAILGLFVAATGALVKMRGEEPIKYMVMVGVLYSALLIPRVTVTITDLGVGAGAAKTVANVPIGLAFFASTTSKIGHFFTDRMETFFSAPEPTMNFSQSGFMGSSRALRMSQSMNVSDSNLQMDMQEFFRDCLYPELVSAGSYQVLVSSTDIWPTISTAGFINPGRMVQSHTLKQVISCDNSYANLTAQLDAEAAKQAGILGQLLWPNAPTASSLAAAAALLPAADTMVFGASLSAPDRIRQGLVINLLEDTKMNISAAVDDPAAVMAAQAKTSATLSANSAYLVMGEMSRETLPIIRNAIELMIIGIFPIVFILIIIAGHAGTVVLRHYVLTMVWVQLWAPLYAIANYIVTLNTAAKIKASGNGIAGLAIDNMASLNDAMISTEAVAGVLTIAVPMIAMSIVKGGEVAMSSLASTITGPAQSAGQSHGAAAGVGSASVGQVSWGSASAYKYNTTPQESTGYGSYTSTDRDGGATTTYGKGATYTGPQNSVPFTAGEMEKNAIGYSQRSSEATSAAIASGNSFRTTIGSAIQSSVGNILKQTEGWQTQTGHSATGSAGSGLSTAQSDQINTQLAALNGTMLNTQTSLGGSIDFGIGASADTGRVGGNTQGSSTTTERTPDQMKKGVHVPDNLKPSTQYQSGSNQSETSSARVKGSAGAAVDMGAKLTAAHDAAVKRGDTATAAKIATAMTELADRVQKLDSAVSGKSGDVTDTQSKAATLDKAKSADAAVAANLNAAKSYEKAATQARELASSSGVAWDKVMDAGQARDLTQALRFGNSEDKRAAIGKLAEIAHAGDYKDMPKNHGDGAPAIGSADDVKRQHQADVGKVAADGPPAISTGAATAIEQDNAANKQDIGAKNLSRAGVEKWGSLGAPELKAQYEAAVAKAEQTYGATSDQFREEKGYLDAQYTEASKRNTLGLAAEGTWNAATGSGNRNVEVLEVPEAKPQQPEGGEGRPR